MQADNLYEPEQLSSFHLLLSSYIRHSQGRTLRVTFGVVRSFLERLYKTQVFEIRGNLTFLIFLDYVQTTKRALVSAAVCDTIHEDKANRQPQLNVVKKNV